MSFSDNYTENIKDYYLDYEDNYRWKDLNKINKELDSIPDFVTPAEFREKLEQIRQEYFCSARRYLMDYVKKMSEERSDGSFVFIYNEKHYYFSGAGMKAALSLEKKERDQYIQILTDIAISNSGDENDNKAYLEWRRIFRIAMLWNKNPRLLTKEDSLKLCHGLHFTLSQAQDFLVRVTENDGFNFVESDDLIDAFCFLHIGANNWHIAKKLKEEYQLRTINISKTTVDEKLKDGTRLVLEELPGLIKKWENNLNEKSVNGEFMQWLVKQSSSLDKVSKTSCNVYRKLCYIALEMILDQEENMSVFYDEEESIIEYVMDLYEEYKDDIEKIASKFSVYEVEEKLVTYAAHAFDNRHIQNKKEYWKTWRYITIGSDGSLMLQSIGNRIHTLLSGDDFVHKVDLLFVIWLICDIYWCSYDGRKGQATLNNRIQDVLVFAEEMLNDALLPDFYAPHLMEQSMLLSICCTYDAAMTEIVEPFEVYQEICESYVPRRSGRKIKKENENQHDKFKLNHHRLIWEAEVKEDFCNNKLCCDGMEEIIWEHLINNSSVKKEYVFIPKGIYFAPDPTIIINYSDQSMKDIFDKNNMSYKSIEANEQRFKYLFAIYLYLQKNAYDHGFSLNCGVYYKAVCKISITKWEKR